MKVKKSALASNRKETTYMDLSSFETGMQKGMERLAHDLARLRTGRASPSLIENIKVDYFGTATPINQLGQIAVPDSRTLQVTCWDQSAIAHIEKAINAANIGLTPNVDGKIIRMSIPALSEERRKDIVKSVKKLGEEAKITVRAARRDANEEAKSQEKAKSISKDELKKAQDDVQKLTDKFTKEIDKIIDTKSKDILSL